MPVLTFTVPILLGDLLLVGAPRHTIESVVIESGSCKSLKMLEKDFSATCDGKLLNTSYKDGRSGFYFVTKDGVAVTFSGDGNAQVMPTANDAVQPIDSVIFGTDHQSQKAVGFCRFSNPFQGKPVSVSCSATTAIGDFGGDFETDGSAPNVKRF